MAEPNPSVRTAAPSGDWDARADFYAGRIGLGNRPIRLLMLAVVLAAGYAVVAAPLQPAGQVLFAVICLAAAVLLDRIEGRLVSIGLIALSTLLSARYIHWRVTQSMDYGDARYDWVDIGFAFGLLGAEIYAFIVLVLGYLQTLWPLQRLPVPMPRDIATWPTVDVLIPTLDEPVSVLRPTLIAALDMNWPRDRMRVLVLDDGRRDEVAALCHELGAIHVQRPDNRHAKAGNLNHALGLSTAEYVAIFDCDHVPTRSFLDVSMGWFLKDRRLAMLQTPQHFFSPDPFERNLGTFHSVPNENELFYGLLQDGNDLWNATFFCGSCAVLRRSALDEVGGVAVETVTEDAHTSLRLQRAGWNTAYINLPQAAGRATESLASHIRQRMRWARGMSQVLRIDNPLFGRGLTLAQRLCYLNSMLFFFSGLPRIVFLTAPLAYLFFDAQIIIASALVLAAYALPHLVHAQMTHSRLQGTYRHSFWAEIYETVLCVYIVLPTLWALIDPRRGRFDVTPKGTCRERAYFDRRIALPYIVLLALNVAGFGVGLWSLVTTLGSNADTLVLNLLWTAYNIVILSVCTAVAWEQREIRRSVRVTAELSARIRLPDGFELGARTLDLSEGGVMVRLARVTTLPLGTRVEVALASDHQLVWTPADVTRCSGEILAMRFPRLTLPQERQLVYAIFGRADAWLGAAGRRVPDRIGTAFGRLLALGASGAKKASLFASRR